MTGKPHKIRRMLTAMMLSATAALLVVPLAQARLDDYASSLGNEPRATQFKDHILDVSARDTALAIASVPSDNILDVSARDSVQAVPSATPDLRGDFMFQQYFRDAAKANDHILDVSARDTAPVDNAPVTSDPTGGTDWGEIGIGIALTLGGVLLLVVLVAVGVQVSHSRHPVGNA